MKQKSQLIIEIIFFGAIWGILEATLGYVLHLIPAFIAGIVMFPIAAIILIRAYMRLQSKLALLGIGFVAAMIKSVNLLLPGMNIWKTINPIISIIFEACLVVGVISLLSSNKRAYQIVALPIASIGWRLLYLAYAGLQIPLTQHISAHLKSIEAAFSFVILSGLLSGLIATALYFTMQHLTKGKPILLKIRPLLAIASFVLAILLTVIL